MLLFSSKRNRNVYKYFYLWHIHFSYLKKNIKSTNYTDHYHNYIKSAHFTLPVLYSMSFPADVYYFVRRSPHLPAVMDVVVCQPLSVCVFALEVQGSPLPRHYFPPPNILIFSKLLLIFLMSKTKRKKLRLIRIFGSMILLTTLLGILIIFPSFKIILMFFSLNIPPSPSL